MVGTCAYISHRVARVQPRNPSAPWVDSMGQQMSASVTTIRAFLRFCKISNWFRLRESAMPLSSELTRSRETWRWWRWRCHVNSLVNSLKGNEVVKSLLPAASEALLSLNGASFSGSRKCPRMLAIKCTNTICANISQEAMRDWAVRLPPNPELENQKYQNEALSKKSGNSLGCWNQATMPTARSVAMLASAAIGNVAVDGSRRLTRNGLWEMACCRKITSWWDLSESLTRLERTSNIKIQPAVKVRKACNTWVFVVTANWPSFRMRQPAEKGGMFTPSVKESSLVTFARKLSTCARVIHLGVRPPCDKSWYNTDRNGLK